MGELIHVSKVRIVKEKGPLRSAFIGRGSRDARPRRGRGRGL